MLLLPLSLAMDEGEFEGEFDHGGGGGGGGGGGPAAAAAAAVAAVDDRDRWRWRLMVAAALDGGNATISRSSETAAQIEDKRAAQGEATQQLAYLPPNWSSVVLPQCYPALSSAMPLLQYTALALAVPPWQ
jgi:hypothetical protein